VRNQVLYERSVKVLGAFEEGDLLTLPSDMLARRYWAGLAGGAVDAGSAEVELACFLSIPALLYFSGQTLEVLSNGKEWLGIDFRVIWRIDVVLYYCKKQA
jgi:hypothetical protein